MNFDKLTPKQQEVTEKVLGLRRRFTLLYGGSRSGKTFLLCSAIAGRSVIAPGGRHLILRKFKRACEESIALDTFPKAMATHLPEIPFKWDSNYGYFRVKPHPDLPESEVWIGGVDDRERFDKLLGKEYVTIYGNELSELPYDIYTSLQSRLAQQVPYEHDPSGFLAQRFYGDLNPTTSQHWTYKLFVEHREPATGAKVNGDLYAVGRMNPTENPLLGQEYIESLEALPERDRKRFYSGEFAQDAPGAIWRRGMIRYSGTGDVPDTLTRLVVAIDPAVSTGAQADETGIIVAGVDQAGVAHIIEDASGRYPAADDPNDTTGESSWARIAVSTYHEHQADCIIAEANQGGDMVKAVIEAVDRNVPVKLVKATRGKVLRAEPAANLYAKGKVEHLRRFGDLEDQMCSLTPDFDRKSQGWSPDRVDALVWALTDLFPHLTKDRRPGRGQRVVQSNRSAFA